VNPQVWEVAGPGRTVLLYVEISCLRVHCELPAWTALPTPLNGGLTCLDNGMFVVQLLRRASSLG
jgi:hypothetical protein